MKFHSKELPYADPLILDIGCGDEKQTEGAVGIDVKETEAADLVIDAEQMGIPYPDNTVDEIHARMSFEHMDAEFLIAESHRVLRPGGKLHLTVPHPFTTGFWQDWTHRIQPGFTVDGIGYLSADHRMHYEHDMGSWDVEETDVKFWLNLSTIAGRAVSAVGSAIAALGSARMREELLKLPFSGGWLEAELQKPTDNDGA